MKKYFKYIKKYWYCFLFGPFFMVLEAAGEFILPLLSKKIVDVGAANGDTGYIISKGLIMAAIAVGMLITGILGANFAIRGASRTAAGLRLEVFKKIQTFSFSDIDRFTAGSLITRITNDITQIQSFIQSLLRGMFRSPVMLAGALIMAFTMNPAMAKILLITVPVLAVFIAAVIIIATPRYTKMQQQLDELNIDTRESIVNEKVVKSFVREDFEKKKFGVINEKLRVRSTKALKMMLLIGPATTLAISFTTVAVVWLAGGQLAAGNLEIGTLTAFITYLTQVLNALNFLANIVLTGTRAAASDKRITEVLNTSPEISDENPDHTAAVREGSVSFKNVSFRYFRESREPVLDNISLDINAGELVGIVGPTGCGKTTLVSLLSRLYVPESGEIIIGGRNIKEYSLKALESGIAAVLQKNTLFSGNIEENLRWGNDAATEGELTDAAKLASAHDFIMSFAEGYKTELGQGGANLSGGQKQRLCIARAVLKKPKILILDDSTSAVDTATDARIRSGLRENLPGTTKIIIAQRINSVIDADKIIVMNEGKIAGIGTHSELLESCDTYRDIYLSQQGEADLDG